MIVNKTIIKHFLFVRKGNVAMELVFKLISAKKQVFTNQKFLNKKNKHDMKKIILFLMILFSCLSMQAQKETNNWTFGRGAYLTWNTTRTISNFTTVANSGATGTTLTGLPTVPEASGISSDNGCFTLSDSEGRLLCYSDGASVWDKNHQVMPNGTYLSGSITSAQSGVLFPYSGTANQFVAVTTGKARTVNTFKYSVIDMSLRSGLGDVVAGKKNLAFPNMPPTDPNLPNSYTFTETVTAFQVPNSPDFWVLSLGKSPSTSYLHAWRFTPSGPLAPVITAISPAPAKSIGDAPGHLKISPDGKHFIYSGASSAVVVWGDFNANTGTISNMKNTTGFVYPYGIEFSPDGSVIYINSQGNLNIFKADEFFATSDINNMSKRIFGIATLGDVQLAPDGRVYVVDAYSSGMIIVADPNNFTSPKIYRAPQGFLDSTSKFLSGIYGLPNFPASYFAPVDPACYKPAVTTGTTEPIKTIISTLDRKAVPRDMSDPRSGSLILESKTRGLVITRIASPETAITTPVEGMIVYDTTVKALKLYNGTVWKLLEAACPDN